MATEKWKPEIGERYFYIDIAYEEDYVVQDKNAGWSDDAHRSEVGNCFKNKAEANKKLELIKSILKQP